MRMLVNAQIAKDLHAAWDKDETRRRRQDPPRRVPSVAEFETLVDVLFRASLLQEEGVPVTASIAWITEEEFYEYEVPHRRETDLALRFESPLELVPQSIAKLNRVTNGTTSALLADGDETSQRIWGVCYCSDENEIPAQTEWTRHFSPECPTITITGVGSLHVTRGLDSIGRIENGEYKSSYPRVTASKMIGRFLYRLLDVELDETKHRFATEKDSRIAGFYIDCVDFMLKVLAQKSCGATVIVVPMNRDASNLWHSPWKTIGSLEIDKLEEGKRNFSSSSLFGLKINRVLHTRLRSLVDLATIDGALLLSPKMDVVSFGAKLKAPAWRGQMEPGAVPNIGREREIDFHRLGTRHSSARDFVGAVDQAIAFVASSDGPIRALTKIDDSKILYWGDCRVSHFK